MMGGIDTVGYFGYGMKSPVEHMLPTLCLLEDGEGLEVDLGWTTYSCPSESSIPICSPRVNIDQRGMTTFPLFSGLGTSGTVRASNVFPSVSKLKVYPGWVHVLKAEYPESLMPVPKTVKQGKLRMTYLERVHDEFQANSERVVRNPFFTKVTRGLRAEASITVSGLDDSGDEDALWTALSQMQVAVDKWILDNLFISSLTFLDLSNNLGFYLTLITGDAFLRKRNEDKLSQRKIRCIATVQNQAGVSTEHF